MVAQSYEFASGDGSTVDFPISLLKLATTDIYVTVDGTPKNLTTDYIWTTSDTVIQFLSAPATGTNNILFQRKSPKEWSNRAVDFTVQTFLQKTDLDTNQRHMLYLIQEALETDDSLKVSPNAEYIRWDSVTSTWSAASVPAGDDRKISDVEDPTANQHAATKKYVDDIAEFATAGVPQHFNMVASGGSHTSYTLTAGANIETAMCMVMVEDAFGVHAVQQPFTEFTVVKGSPDSTLVLTTAPAAGKKVTVMNFGKHRFLNSTVIKDGGIETNHLANLSVTEGKLADAAVTASKLDSSAVTTAKISNIAVDGTKIAPTSVDLAHLDLAGWGGTTGAGDKVLQSDSVTGALSEVVLTASDISDLVTWLATQPLSGLAAAGADLAMGSNKITGLADPTAPQEAATRQYVLDNVSSNAVARVRLVNEVNAGAVANWEFNGSGAWITSGYNRWEFSFTDFRAGSGLTIRLGYKILGTWYDLDLTSGGYFIPNGSVSAPSTWGFFLTDLLDAGTYGRLTIPSQNGQLGRQLGFLTAGTVQSIRLDGFIGNIPAALRVQIYGDKTA